MIGFILWQFDQGNGPAMMTFGAANVLCSHCHGKHFVVVGERVQPCEECGGLGEVHCCEGLQAQPETPPDESSDPLREPLARLRPA